MSKEKTHEFHIADRGFKFLLETTENKVKLLEFISPSLIKDLDLESIQASKTSVIEPSFREIIEDVAFDVKHKTSGEELQILVIVAHQSSRDRFMPFRILRMMTGYWSEELRAEPPPKKLKAIQPILVYTGEKVWNLAETEKLFDNCFAGLALGETHSNAVPFFEIQTLNLGSLDIAELLEKETELAFGLALYRIQFSLAFHENCDKILGILKSNSLGLSEERQSQYLQLLFQLTAKNQSKVTSRELLSRSLEVLADERYKTMVKTYEQELLERGAARGRLEALKEAITRLILRRFPQTLEEEAKKRLEAIEDPKRLQSIMDRVIDWKNYEDVWTIPDSENS